MKVFKFITAVGFLGLVSIGISCTNSPDKNQQENQEEPVLLAPPNGDDTRYNLDDADTMVLPVDTNMKDTSDRRL